MRIAGYPQLPKPIPPSPNPPPRGDFLHGWTQEVPTKPAWYWHWNGVSDDSPFIYSVLMSGTKGKSFVSNIAQSPWCEDVGGWWQDILPPPLPMEGAV